MQHVSLNIGNQPVENSISGNNDNPIDGKLDIQIKFIHMLF
jgi:hypothetical protein